MDQGNGAGSPAEEKVTPATDDAALKRVVEAARIWLTDRTPSDVTEKLLAAAVARSFPEDMQTKENCECGHIAECEDCLSEDELDALVSKWEREAADAAL